MDATTGKEVGGPFQLGQRIESAPVVDNGTLYFGCNNGTFYALDAQTGEKRWTRMDARTRRTVGFSYVAGEAISSAPLFVGDMMLFQTSDNQVHGLKQATGNFRWKTRMPFSFLPNGMTASGSSVFVATGPALYAILPASSAERWHRSLPNDILAAPVVANGIVYVGCKDAAGDGGLFYAIKDNGREQWKAPAKLPFAPAGAPVVSGDVIYIPGQRGTVMGVDAVEGKLLWSYRLQASTNRVNVNPGTETIVAAPLALSGGTLYSLSSDGTLTAFRADAADSSGPVLSELYPRAGSALNGKPPFQVSAKIIDDGTGLNPDTISASMDGKDITVTFDSKRSMIFYKTQSTGRIVDPPLADGRHEFTLRAKDWRGNETSKTWSFVIDNSLPVRGTGTNSPQPGGGRTGGGALGGGGKAGGGG